MKARPFAPSHHRDNFRVIWSCLRVARKTHVLNCGCVLRPGFEYHSAGLKFPGQRALVVSKQHVAGCLEVIH